MIFVRAAQREFAQVAAAVFVALFAILLSTVLIRLLAQAAGGRIPADAVFALIGFGALAQLPIVLTLSLFIAILSVMTRVYRDSEMVVWFASGVPLTAWMKPVLRFALPLVVVITGCTLALSPWAHFKSTEYRERLSNQDDAARVAPGVFRESAGAQRVFFVEGGAAEDGKVSNVFVSEERAGELSITVAAEGSVFTDALGDRYVVLEHGRRYDGAPGAADFRVLEFERYVVRVESRALSGVPTRAKEIDTPTLLRERSALHLGELAGRLGQPVAALLLALLAIPLSFVNPRAGRANNLLLAILIYLSYSNAISVAQAWVSQGRLGFELGLLAPHLVVVVALLLLFWHRLRQHRPLWGRP